MSSQRDPISVRTTRLNNLILSKHSASSDALLKANAVSGRRSVSVAGGALVSAAVAEALGREGLLDAFLLLYDECDKEALKERDCNIKEFVNKFRPIIEETRRLRVNEDDFVVKKLIGKGYFGNVHLVVEQPTGDVYAMKKINKSAVTIAQVKAERDIMSRRGSEWITNLQYAFQDSNHLYLVMEYLPGGDLYGLMVRHGAFDEEWARFYLAELTLAIHSLHTMGFVHRDIKPENILIDRFGHLKLADFGNAAALNRDGQVLCLSPVGTPDYIAPELLQTIYKTKPAQTKHDISCDYWAMGIIGYELICETTPFYDDNVHETFAKVINHSKDILVHELITYPPDLKVSTEFKNLIASLLTKSTNRLSYEQVRKHPYFVSIEWETLRSQVPPIIPAVNAEDDTSNFDDVMRHKGRHGSQVKKPLVLPQIKSHDFSGKDLPFIGYTFVHMEWQSFAGDDCLLHDARVTKLNAQLKDMQGKIKERADEVGKLQKALLHAERDAKQSDTRSKILNDAKEEILKMKNTIKEKTQDLATCRTHIKTLQSSIRVEEEIAKKKEATITELLRLNRQKYEEAKIASELRYEKIISEKKHELAILTQKLDTRESELNGKAAECTHMQEKMENYKEMLRQFKEQAQTDKADFERSKTQLNEAYEQKLQELRDKLRHEKDSKSRLTLELRDVRTELDDNVQASKTTKAAMHTTERNNDDLLQRLNSEIKANNALHAQNAQLEQRLATASKEILEAQQETQRLERELQVAECGKKLSESPLSTEETPYETATGSLAELYDVEDQLRTDLEVARENEKIQRDRADQLQKMLENFNEQSATVSPSKPLPAPRNATAPGATDMLERQNEKLEDKLTTVREQMIVERQAARAANLALWKVEKQLEETLAAQKLTLRRMELTEERTKKIQAEREEAKQQYKTSQAETQQRTEHITELKKELAALKRDISKEHSMWEKAEQERMQSKSEIIEHIANVHKLEERATELHHKLQQSQQKCDTLALENKRLLRELHEERNRTTAAGDSATSMKIELKNLQGNYERLKYACTITDSQLTEVEGMLEAEQLRAKTQQLANDKLYASVRQRDEAIVQLQRELDSELAQRQCAEDRVQTLMTDMEKHKLQLQDLQKHLVAQQQQLLTQTSDLYETQERVEVLTGESLDMQTLAAKSERELTMLKEENSRILSELYHAKEEVHRLQAQLTESVNEVNNRQADISELRDVLAEKETHYRQRDIKSEATLAQHKKLIDYLQMKVEDLTQKKKKTLGEKLFGTSASSARKENISPNAVETSILYRTLQEELCREKQRCKTLQQQIDKLNSLEQSIVRGNAPDISLRERNGQLQHHFELALHAQQESSCKACDRPIVAGLVCWKCRECKLLAHRKCRSDVPGYCGVPDAELPKQVAEATTYVVTDAESIGKYSYEGKVDHIGSDLNIASGGNDYGGTLVFNAARTDDALSPIEVNCAYEIEDQRILLLGCNNGLYAYHWQASQLVHIAGIDSVKYIAISVPLAKAIMVGVRGESLYQCDYRQLLSLSHANACLNPALKVSVLDLPFANRQSTEKWQLVKISTEVENPIDSVAIGATSTRIVIFEYDECMQQFKPVRALDTATPVSSILYTRHTAIVSSDKFFEIDLSTYAAEEFVDLSDQSLSHTGTCHPVVALRISKQEFLLCFMECGIFVDEYGCRSRPFDLNWEYTPTGFVYREPFLYIAHFQSVQVMRLNRSYTKEVSYVDEIMSPNKGIHLPFYMPTLLTESGKLNAYMLAIQKASGTQEIYHLDALLAFKQQLNESLGTVSSMTLASAVSSEDI